MNPRPLPYSRTPSGWPAPFFSTSDNWKFSVLTHPENSAARGWRFRCLRDSVSARLAGTIAVTRSAGGRWSGQEQKELHTLWGGHAREKSSCLVRSQCVTLSRTGFGDLDAGGGIAPSQAPAHGLLEGSVENGVGCRQPCAARAFFVASDETQIGNRVARGREALVCRLLGRI